MTKIQIANKVPKNYVKVNFYRKAAEKKQETKISRFLNQKFDQKKLNSRKFIQLIRQVVQKAKKEKRLNLLIDFADLRKMTKKFLDNFSTAKLISENILLAAYNFDKFKTKKDKLIKEVVFLNASDPEVRRGIDEGRKIAESMNICRDLANTPGADMTPNHLLTEAKKMFRATKVKLSALDERAAKKLGMNLFLAVGKGSKEKSKFIIARYQGAAKSQRPIVLVGKGVCFDTGGLNLKPSSSILGMNMDMTGGAVVLSTLLAVSKLKLKKNLVALVPAVENSVSGESYRPGDIIRAMSGKTVEILNTDAEGRLVLADALTYAQRFNPRLVIDVATLTGSALSAMGQRASVIMCPNQELETRLRELGEKTGDYVWPLPTWEEYSEDIKGNFADIKNIATGGNTSGVITAGMFLYEFVQDYKKDCLWAHFDIAPRMESAKDDKLSKGATGEPIRLLTELIKEY